MFFLTSMFEILYMFPLSCDSLYLLEYFGFHYNLLMSRNQQMKSLIAVLMMEEGTKWYYWFFPCILYDISVVLDCREEVLRGLVESVKVWRSWLVAPRQSLRTMKGFGCIRFPRNPWREKHLQIFKFLLSNCYPLSGNKELSMNLHWAITVFHCN